MSQQNQFDLLESVAGWDAEKCRQNVDLVLPEMLMKFKESTYIAEGIGCLQVICNNFVPVVPLEEVDDRIFSHILDPTHSLVKDVLNKIHLNVEGSLRDTVEELKDVIIECLQESSTLYGNLLDDLGEPLSVLFKKAHSLQLTLLSLLDKTTVPNSGLEEHVNVLCTVCNGLFEMCKVVTSLDIKLVVSLWKSISRLCSQNQSLLRDRMDVCPLICYLCEELTTGYTYLFQLCPTASGESLSQGDNKTFTKCLKVQGFQMKVLVALLRDFVDYLGPCEQQVLKLLLYILRCLPPCLSSLSASESQENEIRGQVANAVVPVLQHLVTNRAFRIHLTAAGMEDMNHEDHLPLLLLQLNILDLLPKCDVDVVDCWLSQANHDSVAPSKNLLMAIFQSAERCYVEMRVPVMLPGPMMEGKPQSQISLYQHIAVHLCGFIGACPARHFAVLESCLLEVVFGKDEMSSLLATDCWCFLARYGSASLCFDHVKSLLQTLRQVFTKSRVKSPRSHVTQSKLVFLVRRLIKFLSPEHQASLVDLCVPEHNLDLWLTLTLTPFCEKIQNSLGKMFVSSAIKILDADSGKADKVLQALDCLNQLFSNPSSVSSCLDPRQQAVLLDAVSQLWANQLSLSGGDFKAIQDTLLVKLLPVTKFFLSAMEVPSILKMLQVLLASLTSLKTHAADASPPSHVACAEFMGRLGSCQIQPHQEREELLSTIPNLFHGLMTHGHPLVQTKALSSFGHFASHTPHEECIPSCLQSDDGLKTRLNNYLNQVPHRISDEPFVMLDYLRRTQQQRNNNNNIANGVGMEEGEENRGVSVTVTDSCGEKQQEQEDDDWCDEIDEQCNGVVANKAKANGGLADVDPLEMNDRDYHDVPPAKRPKLKLKEPKTTSSKCQDPTEETAVTAATATRATTSPPTFQNILERLKVAADDLESVCSSNGAVPPKDFVDQTKIVMSRISDFINEPSFWFDSLA